MDNLSTMGAISHRLELYTDTLLIQGSVHGPFKRATDLLNRGDSEFISVQKATITPLGQPPSQRVMESSVMVSRSRLHFAVDADAEPGQTTSPRPPEGNARFGREAYIQKVGVPCYAITSVYAIHGYCHLLQDAILEHMLRGSDPFIPITQPTIYLVARPTVSWQREVVIVNRSTLTAIYLLEPVDAAVAAQQLR